MTSSPRLARRTITCAAGALAALVAACGSGTAAPTVTVTVTQAPTEAGAAGGTPSPTPTGSSTPASPAAAPGCATRDLQVKLGASQGAAGSTYTVIDFTNTGTASCALYGYPGVALAGGSPVAQIGAAAAESDATPRLLVTLAPGATGNALLRIVDAGNFPPGRCHPVAASFLQVFPPNQTTPTYVPTSAQACAKRVPLLTIGVVQPGTGSSS
jgi:hypothetical protein